MFNKVFIVYCGPKKRTMSMDPYFPVGCFRLFRNARKCVLSLDGINYHWKVVKAKFGEIDMVKNPLWDQKSSTEFFYADEIPKKEKDFFSYKKPKNVVFKITPHEE